MLLKSFVLYAKYNQRMNRQVYEAILSMEDEIFHKPLKAYFSSLCGTLNHIAVGDILWMQRFSIHPSLKKPLQTIKTLPSPTQLNDILFKDKKALQQLRVFLDEAVIDMVNSLHEEDLPSLLTYRNSKEIEHTKPLGLLLLHFFNHQTHHRGQVSTMLSQLGKDIGVTDLLQDIH